MANPHLNIPDLTPEEIARFRSKIAPPNANGCELWTAGVSDRGYGHFGIRRNRRTRNYRANRVAYFLHYSEQPSTLMVCHNCPSGDNPACVAKAHLFLGTCQDNMIDAAKKGRMATGDRNGAYTHPERRPHGDRHSSRTHPERVPRGERQGIAKLTDDKVRRIRALQGSGKSQREIGAMFGVHLSTVSLIWHNKSWKHVT